MSVGDVRAGAQRSQGIRLLGAGATRVSYATQVLGAQLGSTTRAGCTLTLEPSPQPSKLHFKGLSRDARASFGQVPSHPHTGLHLRGHTGMLVTVLRSLS